MPPMSFPPDCPHATLTPHYWLAGVREALRETFGSTSDFLADLMTLTTCLAGWGCRIACALSLSACTPASDAQGRFICREVDRLGQGGRTSNKDPTAFSLAFLTLLRLCLSLSLSSGLRASCLVHGFFASLPACLPVLSVYLMASRCSPSLPSPAPVDAFTHSVMHG